MLQYSVYITTERSTVLNIKIKINKYIRVFSLVGLIFEKLKHLISMGYVIIDFTLLLLVLFASRSFFPQNMDFEDQVFTVFCDLV